MNYGRYLAWTAVMAVGLVIAGCGAIGSEQGKAGIEKTTAIYGAEGDLKRVTHTTGRESCTHKVKVEKSGAFLVEGNDLRAFQGQAIRSETSVKVAQELSDLGTEALKKLIERLSPLTQQAEQQQRRCEPYANAD